MTMAYKITHITLNLSAGASNTCDIIGGAQKLEVALTMLRAHRKVHFMKVCALALIQDVPDVIVTNAQWWVDNVDNMPIRIDDKGVVLFDNEYPDCDYYTITEI